MANIDLHIHSNFSDGDLSIKNLMASIKFNGIKSFSITDHDNIYSIEEAKIYLDKNSLYIPGVELSCSYGKAKIHLLGYFIQPDGYVKQLCRETAVIRQQALYYFIKDLKKRGYEFEDKDLDRFSDFKYSVGKVDLAKLLRKYGYCKSIDEGFNVILKRYALGKLIRKDVKTAIEAIKNDHGIAILAHPGELVHKQHINSLPIIDDLIEYGLDGIEVYNSCHTQEDIEKYEKYGKAKQLVLTGGSDYHGQVTKPNVFLGQGIKEENIHDIFKY